MNGQIKPIGVKSEREGKPIDWFMVYHEMAAKPLPLCGVYVPEVLGGVDAPPTCEANHGTSVLARNCVTAKRWIKALSIHGWRALEVLQEAAAE